MRHREGNLAYCAFILVAIMSLSISSVSTGQPAGYNPVFFRDLARLLRMASDQIRDSSARAAAERSIQNTNMTEILDWTKASGFLIDIRVEQVQPAGNTRVVNGYPWMVGAGNAPDEVLANDINSHEWSYRPGPSDGFKISSDHSFYIWVQLDEGALNYGYISPDFSKTLTRNSLQLARDNDLVRQKADFERNRAYEQVLRKLEGQIADDRVKKALGRLDASIKENHRKRSEIQQQLEKDLAEAAKAQEFQDKLRALKGILSFAMLVNEANALFGDSIGEEIAGATNEDELIVVTRSYEIKTRDMVVRGRQQLRFNRSRELSNRLELKKSMRNQGVPDSVLRYLD